ncbi:MAG: DUF3761 domain-containing protein [Candidatus Nomurabacteria bacterium]|nr:DUF3761 domain-containing protein [Candidatus Nomurabacteria bacterium]
MEEKKWYQKRGYIVIVGIIAILGFNAFAQSGNTTQLNTSKTQYNSTYSIPSTQVQTTENNNLSNSNYYTNTYGNTVHSPAYSENGSIPAGASARCRDGTYSFSQSARGTCSHHGGVSEWI